MPRVQYEMDTAISGAGIATGHLKVHPEESLP